MKRYKYAWLSIASYAIALLLYLMNLLYSPVFFIVLFLGIFFAHIYTRVNKSSRVGRLLIVIGLIFLCAPVVLYIWGAQSGNLATLIIGAFVVYAIGLLYIDGRFS